MGIMRASATTQRRMAAAIRRVEEQPAGQHGPKPSALHTPQPDEEEAFELTEEIPEVHPAADEYAALIRDWDPTQNAGKGAYVTGATTIVVRDIREIGYHGASGHVGACKIRYTSTGTRFGEIIDMECP